MISAELLVTLLQLKTYALERKAELLRGGRGLQETEIPDEPEIEDYIFEEAAPALPIRNDSNIADILNKIKKDDQIDIEEAIANAAPVASAIASSAPTAATGAPAVNDERPVKLNLTERIRSFRDARTAWRVEKYRIEDKDRRAKRDVLDKCYGYDDMIAFINKLIKNEQERNASIVRPEDAEL